MALLGRHERKVWALALAVLALGMWYGNPALSMKAPLTMEQIDAGMRQSIEDKPLLSPATQAYEAIIPSIVRVVGLMTEGDDGNDDKERGVVERGVGTGVVIIDNGTILTNLHVVQRRQDDPASPSPTASESDADRGRRAARERPGGAAGADACPTT